ncbi:MAG: DUF5689 domain-containing protein [Bacteroidales bacterium]
MNKHINRTILLSLTALVLSLTACVKGDFETPPIIVPKVAFKANSTISALLIKYPGACDSIRDTVIISGIVTANDESGNLYKKMVIQDGTAGLEVEIDQTSLYLDYRVGQRVFIKCQGMYLGRYNNLPQIGYIYNGNIGRLPAVFIKPHIFLDSLPGKKIEPIVVLPTSLNISMVSKLVRIEGVSFADAGSPWADATASGDRGLEGGPTTFVVRTSNFASFATQVIPSGSGTIQGILSLFGTTYQLAIRDTSDIIGFKNIKTFFSESFASSLGAFTTVSVTGDQVWGYNASYGAVMSGFANTINNANEDWLISPAIDLTTAASGILKFSHAINKGDVASVQSDHTVWISKNYSSGAPASATWEQLTVPGYPAGTDWTFVSSGDVVIPAAFIGQTNVKIAFKYLSSSTQSASWEIKSVKVTE